MNIPIIIFEGSDRIGKGEHISRLIDLYNYSFFTKWKTYHCEGPDRKIAINKNEQIYYQLFTFYNQLKEIQELNKPIIFDRSFLGEDVWSLYYNRYTEIRNTNDFGFVTNRIINSDVFNKIKENLIVIFLYGDNNIISERIKNSEEDTRIYTNFCKMNIDENVQFIQNQFKILENNCKNIGLNTLNFKSNTIDDINNNVKQIIKILKKME